MATFYLDYENGSDSNDGSTWALAWKTITNGATAARIAPGDVIRIAKSPAPSSIGNGTWTNLSKTVTLASAQTDTIDLCESAWTAGAGGDTTVARTAVATDAKEGSYCMKLTFDASVQTSKLEAYYATGTLDLSAYQKISFWIKNSGAITAGTLRIALCSDVAGATPVDYFDIPAIPSTGQWVPLTLTKSGGGNLGSSIQSIAVYTNSAVTGLASKYIYIDDFISCTTAGLNLQSLISKNSAEQGGTEGWYGIQSINGTTLLIDNSASTKANDGRGYSGTTETVTTYKRETIKTALESSMFPSTGVQTVQEGGTLGSNIEFQGGYDTSTSLQTGETFFDGLNGYGWGIYINALSFITLNHLNFSRYYSGLFFKTATDCLVDVIQNLSNNANYGIQVTATCANIVLNTIHNGNNNGLFAIYVYSSSNITFDTIGNINNNYTPISGNGIGIVASPNCIIGSIENINNNYQDGLELGGSDVKITSISHINANGLLGIHCSTGNSLAYIKSLSTDDNVTAAIYIEGGYLYLENATMAEATKVLVPDFYDRRVYSKKEEGTVNNHWIYTDGGTINSVANDRAGGAGLKWKYAINSSNRGSNYPLDMVLMEIPVTANNQVTVTAYCKKDHATDVVGKLVCRGGQIAGVSSDVTDTKADDTDWEQLQIQFTPTEDGVVEIEGWAEYSAGNSNVYFADVTVSQA